MAGKDTFSPFDFVKETVVGFLTSLIALNLIICLFLFVFI